MGSAAALTWGKELKRGIVVFGKVLVEERIGKLQAQIDALRADVQAMGEMVEEDGEGSE